MPRTPKSTDPKDIKSREIYKYLKESYMASLNGADPNDFPYRGYKYANAVEAFKARIEQRRYHVRRRTEKRRALKEQSKQKELEENKEQTQE